MNLRHREPPTVHVGDHTDRLSRIQPVRHDPDVIRAYLGTVH